MARISLALAVAATAVLCAAGKEYVVTQAPATDYKATTAAYVAPAKAYKPTEAPTYEPTEAPAYKPTKAAPKPKAGKKPTKYMPEKNVCHATYSRCAGAEGKPYFEYGNGCCSSHDTCVEAGWLGYGRFCLPAPPKCYKDGEKCMGAEGYEYVPYAPCCDDSVCMPNKKKGWGSFCMKAPKKTYPAKTPKVTKGYKATTAPPTYEATTAKYVAPTEATYKATEPKYEAPTVAAEKY